MKGVGHHEVVISGAIGMERLQIRFDFPLLVCRIVWCMDVL